MPVIDKPLMDAIVRSCERDFDDLDGPEAVRKIAARLIECISAVESVIASRKAIEADIALEVNRHKGTVKTLNAQLEEVQKKCKHHLQTYHPDPAGGTDSHHSCQTCGKIW